MKEKERLVIVGSGWAGTTLATEIDENKYAVSVISPESSLSYTPLLASAACGLYDFSLVQQPIRHASRHTRIYKAAVQNIDFKAKSLQCKAAFAKHANDEFRMDYDILILAPGCKTNDFGTPGVEENAFLLRNVEHAQLVSRSIQDCFERASIPGTTEETQKQLLHFVVVGAGPTGIEVASELQDLFTSSYAGLYPHLHDKLKISIHDVADQVLSGFDESLQKHAMESFDKKNISVETGSHIEKIEKDYIVTKEKGKIPTGMVIWATGNKPTSLVDVLDVKKDKKSSRLLTDTFLRLLSTKSDTFDGVYAIGDAADVEGGSLPATAEVACQKAEYLARSLSKSFTKEFHYKQKAVVAYLGQNDGVISGKGDYSGLQAWAAWRSKNFLWVRSWRQRILIVIAWIVDFLFGRSVSPR